MSSSESDESESDANEPNGSKEGIMRTARFEDLWRSSQETRDTTAPSSFEKTAILIAKELRQLLDQRMMSDDDTTRPKGSTGKSRFSADEGSRRGRTRSTSARQPQHAETLDRKVETAVDRDHPNTFGGFGLSVLQPKTRPGLSNIRNPEEWIQIEVTVDSGACVSVMPVEVCEGIGILQTALSRGDNPQEYEVANGETIPNLGERKCEVMTVGSIQAKRITFQVADVHKPLLSISACAGMGYDCFLGKEGGSLRDRITGEIIPLDRQGSLYTMKMWVRQDPTVNISQPFGGPG